MWNNWLLTFRNLANYTYVNCAEHNIHLGKQNYTKSKRSTPKNKNRQQETKNKADEVKRNEGKYLFQKVLKYAFV